MTDLQRQLKRNLGPPPKRPPRPPNSGGPLTGVGPIMGTGAPINPTSGAAGGTTLLTSPGPTGIPQGWDTYFDDRKVVRVRPDDEFVLYSATGPGAGGRGPVVLLLHGGGLAALSWAPCVRHLREHCAVVAFDFRGHGGSTTTNDLDLSAGTLVQDVVDVMHAHYGGARNVPPLLVVGHSLGGAIAVRLAAANTGLPLQGVVVVDVVEGTALASLRFMDQVLERRPPSFGRLEDAVAWFVKGGGMNNPESAAITVPSQLTQVEGRWVWRTDLKASEPYWQGWFEGLSDMFLGTSVPKVLLLAGTDRLDKALTIGQMQGKFQLKMIAGTGHYMMEDKPLETANSIAEFHRRLAAISPFVHR